MNIKRFKITELAKQYRVSRTTMTKYIEKYKNKNEFNLFKVDTTIAFIVWLDQMTRFKYDLNKVSEPYLHRVHKNTGDGSTECGIQIPLAFSEHWERVTCKLCIAKNKKNIIDKKSEGL